MSCFFKKAKLLRRSAWLFETKCAVYKYTRPSLSAGTNVAWLAVIDVMHLIDVEVTFPKIRAFIKSSSHVGPLVSK